MRAVSPMPVVLMTMPSISPLPITLVSPVRTIADASRQARAHRREDPLEIGARKSFLEDDAAGEAEHVGRAHHREVVDRAADREPADVAARKERAAE